MRIHNDSEDNSFPINVTNMVDVFMLLLIFFLVATTFATEERDLGVQLPVASNMTPISAAPKQLIINIQQNGQAVIAGQQYDATGLEAYVADSVRQNPAREVLIRADERTEVKNFASVARICRSAGVNELKIGYLIDSTETRTAP
jgi:biopolymer transport protein ExbD